MFLIFDLYQVGMHEKFNHSSSVWLNMKPKLQEARWEYTTDGMPVHLHATCVRDATECEYIIWIEQICFIHIQIQTWLGDAFYFICRKLFRMVHMSSGLRSKKGKSHAGGRFTLLYLYRYTAHKTMFKIKTTFVNTNMQRLLSNQGCKATRLFIFGEIEPTKLVSSCRSRSQNAQTLLKVAMFTCTHLLHLEQIHSKPAVNMKASG